MRCYNVPWLFLAAAVLPLSGAEDCVKDFRAIHELEAAVEDTSVVRKYVICPYRLMKIGNLDFDNNLIDGNDDDINPPLPLRPNMHILCGEQGSKGNLCFVRDGHLQMDGTSIRGIQNPTVDNILIEGFTFIGALHHSLFVTKPGSITFRNCEWREFTRSKAPIMLDFYDAFSNDELVVIFTSCLFRSNRYFGEDSYSALIYGNSDQNRLIIERTSFEGNDMLHNNTRGDTNSFLVETLGPTCVDRSCFIDNAVGSSNIAVFGSQFISSQAHVSNSSGTICAFASEFQSIQQFQDFAPLCIAPMAESCSYELEGDVKPCDVWVDDFLDVDQEFSLSELNETEVP